MKKIYKIIVLYCTIMFANASVFSHSLHTDFKKDILQSAALYTIIAASKTSFNGNKYSYITEIITRTALALGMHISTGFIISLFHELGHAIPAKLFTKQDTEVVLGSYNRDDTSVLTIPSMGILPKISVKSIAHYGITHFSPINNRWHNGLVATAGSIAGFIGGYGLASGFSYLSAVNILSPLWSTAGVTASTYWANNSLLNLIPNNAISDGYCIAQNTLQLSEKNLREVNDFGTNLLNMVSLVKTTTSMLNICYNFLRNNHIPTTIV